MLEHNSLSRKYREFAVCVAVYLKNRTPTGSVVGLTQYESWHESGKEPFSNHHLRFVCLAILHLPKEKRRMVDYRATSGISIGYSISTNQYFVYNPLAKTHHCSRDVVFREGKLYTAPNAADEAIMNEHFYRDVIEEPKPTGKQPTGDGNSKCPMQQPLDNDSPLDSPKPTKKSRELAGLETSLDDQWKPPAEGSRRNRAGKDMLAESAQ